MLISLVLALGLAGTAHAADMDRLYVVSFNESLYPPGSVVTNDTGNLTGSPYIFMIDTISGKVLSAASLKEPANFIVVSPSGGQLYLAGVRSGNIAVINALNLTSNRTFSLNSSVSGIALSLDGSRLYAAMPEVQSIYSLDITSGIVRAIVKLTNTPHDLALSPDGKRMYVMDDQNGSIAIVDAQGSRQLATLKAGSKLVDIAVTPDGRALYAASNDSMISVYDTTTYQLKKVIVNVTRPSSLTTDIQQSWIYATSSSDGSLTRIDAASENVSVVVPMGSYGLGKAVVSTDGLKLFVPESEGKSVEILGVTSLSRLSYVNFTDPAMTLAVGKAPEGSVAIPVPTLIPTLTPQPTIYYPGTWGTPTPFQIPLPIPPKISIAPVSQNTGHFSYKTWLPPFRPLTAGDVVIIVSIYFIVLVVLVGITYIMMFRRDDRDEDDDDDSDDDDL